MTCPGASQGLTVGTDCSGMESVILALRELGVPHSHLFSSEVCEHALKVIRANARPAALFRDITERALEEVPRVDLYVAGPPCQAYSMMNTRRDTPPPPSERPTVFASCLAYIRDKEPRIWILENVRGLLSAQKGRVWRHISVELDAMRESYVWEYAILDSCEYGCPQSRPRVYIVGLHRSLGHEHVPWPARVPLRSSCLDVLDDTTEGRTIAPSSCYYRMCDAWGLPRDTRCIIEFNGASRSYPVYKQPPTRLSEAQRASVARTEVSACMVSHDPGMAALHLRRFLNADELLRLQGYDPRRVRVPTTLTAVQFAAIVGNAMNGCVLKALLSMLVPLLRS